MKIDPNTQASAFWTMSDIALTRIADTLDDYMEMSLSAQEALTYAQGNSAANTDILGPVVLALTRIAKRRAERTYP